MNPLVALLETLSLPDIARILRRAVIAGLVLGAIGLLALGLTGHPLAGLGTCIGVALGLGNIRLIMTSAAKVGAANPANPRRVIASRALLRLAVTTAILVVLAVLSIQLAFGAFGGIAVFYLVFTASVIRSLLSHGAVG